VERIAHRDLRNRSSEILRAVAAGESFEITNHGEVVAILLPPRARRRPLKVKRATRVGGWADIPRYASEESSQDILDDLRGER
jgi:prevent-host-death family protein